MPVQDTIASARLEVTFGSGRTAVIELESIAGMPLYALQSDLLRAQVALGWAFVEALRAMTGLPGVPAEPEGKAT